MMLDLLTKINKCWLFIFLLLFGGLFANDTLMPTDTTMVNRWYVEGRFFLNLGNTGLYNWSGGGASTIAVNTGLNLKFGYSIPAFTWRNRFYLGYGAVYNYKPATAYPYRKSDDLLEYETRLEYVFQPPNWSWIVLGNNLRTQLDVGYDYREVAGVSNRTLVSKIFSPAYNYTHTGINYRKGGKKYKVNLTLSPLAYKQTFVLDKYLSQKGAFGVDSGAVFRGELGWMLEFWADFQFSKNITLDTRLQFFERYYNLKGVDVYWVNQLNMKINNFLSASLGTYMVYDYHAIVLKDDGTKGKALQFKYIVSVGLLIDFKPKKNA